MKIKDFINGNVTYDKEGQYFWVNKPNGGIQMLGELRGWGAIQNMFKRSGKNSGAYIDEAEAAKFQEELGEFIASAINEKVNAT